MWFLANYTMCSCLCTLLRNVTYKLFVVYVNIAHLLCGLIIDFQMSKKGAVGLVSYMR